MADKKPKRPLQPMEWVLPSPFLPAPGTLLTDQAPPPATPTPPLVGAPNLIGQLLSGLRSRLGVPATQAPPPDPLTRYEQGIREAGSSLFNQVNEPAKAATAILREQGVTGAPQAFSTLLGGVPGVSPVDMAAQIQQLTQATPAERQTQAADMALGSVGLPPQQTREAASQLDIPRLLGQATVAAPTFLLPIHLAPKLDISGAARVSQPTPFSLLRDAGQAGEQWAYRKLQEHEAAQQPQPQATTYRPPMGADPRQIHDQLMTTWEGVANRPLPFTPETPPPSPPPPALHPSPEFAPVGAEPAYRPPLLPDPRQAVMETIAKQGGRVGKESPAMQEVQAMHPDPTQRPVWDVLKDERGMVGGDIGPIWYSRLDRAMEALPDNARLHPNKVLGIARSSTHADELKWTGFEQWLGAQKGPVTKADVLNFLKENRLEVEEVLLTDPADVTHIEGYEAANRLAETVGGQVEDYLPPGTTVLPTKFHPSSGHSETLSLPGARGYKELLIKFPDRSQTVGEPVYDGAGGLAQPRVGQQPYTSPHWPGQPNVLAHVRFTDRVSPEGKKVLFIEEAQSDWHQAGRKKGYGPRPTDEHSQLMAVAERGGLPVPDAPFKGTRWQELAMKRMLRYAAEKGYDEVAWTTGLQQTQRYNDTLGSLLGGDRLDWTYEPAPDHSALGPATRATASDNVTLLHPQTGETVWMGPSSDLPGAVGKDLAAQVLKDIEGSQAVVPGDHKYANYKIEHDSDAAQTTPFAWTVLDNQDNIVSTHRTKAEATAWLEAQMRAAADEPMTMRVGQTAIPRDIVKGSAGQVGQYDVAMVNWANKYAKQWGSAVRKGAVQIPETPTNKISIATNKALVDPARSETVWSLPITPAMRSSVLQGQPLGQVGLGPLLHMGSAAAGAVIGGTQGDTPEERVFNALTGGVLGAMAPAGRKLLPTPSHRPAVVDTLAPEVRGRLRQTIPWPHQALGDRLASALKTVRQSYGHGFISEYTLRQPTKSGQNLNPAADALTAFKSKRLEITQLAHDKVKSILQGLEDPSDYRDFWGLVALRRDLNSAELGLPLEANLTPGQVETSLRHLESSVPPNVLEAAQRHRDLMRTIGDDLVARDKVSSLAIQRNSEYYPEYVMEYLVRRMKPEVATLDKPAPIRPGREGYLKPRKGGERETLRQYDLALMKYLTEVEEAKLKDQLVTTLTGQYDATKRGLVGPNPTEWELAQLPGYRRWLYRSGDVYTLPTELAQRLDQWQWTPGDVMKAAQRATNLWKGAALRTVWGSFTLMNLVGDVLARQLFIPVWDWPQAVRTLKEAAVAVADDMRGTDPAALSPQRRAGLELAQRGKAANLGTGAATSEIGIRTDPNLRKLREPQVGLKRLQEKGGDLLNWGIYKMDLIREYMENVPRTAEFIRLLEEGYAPPKAAEITRKIMIDYSDLTPHEEKWFRGLLFPFWTFYKKNFERWMPGAMEDPYVGTRPAHALRVAGATTQGFALLSAVTLYNNWISPEAEQLLPPYLRNAFHINVPWRVGEDGNLKFVTFYFADPMTLAHSAVGLGGIPQRVARNLMGLSSAKDEWSESKRQAWQAGASLLSPFIQVPLSQLTNQDLRTGRDITIPEAGTGENLSRRLSHAVSSFSPVGAVFRQGVADPYGLPGRLPEMLQEQIKSSTVGSMIKLHDTGDLSADRVHEAIGKASQAKARDDRTTRVEWAGALMEGLRTRGPDDALPFIMGFLSTQRGNDKAKFEAIAGEALKRLSDSDKQWRRAYKEYRLWQNRDLFQPGSKMYPYLLDEVRKSIPPATKQEGKGTDTSQLPPPR